MVPYRDGRSDINEVHQDLDDDLEGGDIKKANSLSTNQDPEFEPIVDTDTPFFHIDLQAAVQAAESGVSRRSTSN